MTMQGEPEIRLLTPRDLPRLVELSTEVGWNQTPNDWRRFLALVPDGCFCLESDGQIAATATAIRYGQQLGWLGMVITGGAWRGRGFARRLVTRTLDYFDQHRVATVKLDASDLGRPVYAKMGFVDEYPVERWLRDTTRPGSPHPASSEWSLSRVHAIDREAFGADRGRLLEQLAGFGHASVSGDGYSMDRPGRVYRHFGPCVSVAPASAREWVSDFHSRHLGPAQWDLCPEHAEAARLATDFGFRPARTLMRMRRGPVLPGTGTPSPLAYALAGFEYG